MRFTVAIVVLLSTISCLSLSEAFSPNISFQAKQDRPPLLKVSTLSAVEESTDVEEVGLIDLATIGGMPFRELQRHCLARHLPSTGTTATLRERLRNLCQENAEECLTDPNESIVDTMSVSLFQSTKLLVRLNSPNTTFLTRHSRNRTHFPVKALNLQMYPIQTLNSRIWLMKLRKSLVLVIGRLLLES